ncbi:MAG TPA: DegT/DnrJ/EryC1/StrS family aminotransferase [Chloroflexota bacterium]|nr:DegT/DnrJ/EryC1/StrS family aminotransferase [Chloroflexota bacterium]
MKRRPGRSSDYHRDPNRRPLTVITLQLLPRFTVENIHTTWAPSGARFQKGRPMTLNANQDIPLVDLKRQHAALAPEVDDAFRSILSTMQLFLGPNVQTFEEDFARYLGASDCVGVSDGTTALYLALRACDVGPGDEVITVSHTFFATVEAIIETGATPVFVDVDPDTHTMDVEQAERAVTPRTKAIVPVHLYGRMADMDGVMAVASRNGLKVVEDACQAHGARRNGQAAGTIGDAGCFSFYYSKNLGAYGEAGGIVSNDPTVSERVRVLRDHGSAVRYHHQEVGVNGRLDEMQAAVLRIKLPRLEEWNRQRRAYASLYNERLRDLPIGTPAPAGEDHVFHLYVIRHPRREALRRHLEAGRIHTGIHYPVPCHLQPACMRYGQGQGSLPVTESLADEILSLPMFPELTAEEVDRVCESVAEFFGGETVTGTHVEAAQ